MEKNFIFTSNNSHKTSPRPSFPSIGHLSTLKFTTCSTPNFPKLSRNFSLNFSSPQLPKKPSQDYFPDWLLKRPDFKKIIDPNSKDLDIGNICDQENRFRDELQKKELLEWCQSCVFFQSFSQYTCKEVCSRLFTRRFHLGEVVIKENDPADCLFIIVKGKVEIRKQGKYLDSMGQKNVIGETALESNCLRTATVIAIQELTTLVLNKEDYHKVLSRQKHMLRTDIVGLVKKIPVFQNIGTAKIERMAWQMLILNYSEGHVVYQQNQTPIGIYFIKEGSVDLIFDVTIKVKGKIPGNLDVDIADQTCELLVKNVQKGDFFGEEELLEGIKRKTRAVCAENSVIWFLKEKKFRKTFSDKEKEIIGKFHIKMSSVPVLTKKCIMKFKEEKNKKIAMMDATCSNSVSWKNAEIGRSPRIKLEKTKSLNVRKSLGSMSNRLLLKFIENSDDE